MPKADFATISPLLLLVGLMLPLLISRTVNSNPMTYFVGGIKAKLISSLILWLISSFTSAAYSEKDNVPVPFLVVLTMGMIANECFGTVVFVSAMTFFSKISDSTIGGSYMTLLNTIANWGSKWPNVTVLWLLPKLTLNLCDLKILTKWKQTDCSNQEHTEDGYTLLVIFCNIFGIFWIYFNQSTILTLQTKNSTDWKIRTNKSNIN